MNHFKNSPSFSVKELLSSSSSLPQVTVRGWIRTKRDSRDFSFLELNDGSCLANLQVVVQSTAKGYDLIKDITTGSAVAVEGDLVESQGRGQAWDLKAKNLVLTGPAGADYPLQKKRQTDEYLREMAHVRARTNKYGAMFRIRSECAWAVHRFFREKGFFYVHTPIITGSDAEGAGEMFRVTTLKEGGGTSFKDDFFGQYAALTVSGQLEAELLAHALGRVYTFGPAFRAENSNTARHAAEFWMIEPEAAFFDLSDDMSLAQNLIQSVVRFALNECAEDLALFDRFIEQGLLDRLNGLLYSDYPRIPYAEAIRILTDSGRKFEFSPFWGADLATEHERFLCEEHFKSPVIVFDYPKTIKPFYMRLNDDGQTVAAMDLLVPKVGELVGGSQREERTEVLLSRMAELGLKTEPYWWYLDSRRWGSTPHAGFGLGFERFLMMLTGVSNIRDVIPFPRTPKNLAF
ncbi:MAG: asparagine--tRNA ligase [Deltaproteobacteria bacterium]|jgi:asparaginyl-tRNA synthetase|nr:asparagine--tRNA ligase [Deltaproteobacteria bacterium]